VQTRIPLLVCLSVLAGAAACDPHRAVVLGDDAAPLGDSTTGDDAWRTDGPSWRDLNLGDGPNPAASDYIYLLDDTTTLLRFNPMTTTIEVLGKLACPNASSQVNSMAIDRTARAWIGFHDGTIYWVSVASMSCTKSGFASPVLGFQAFGMGFVANGPQTTREKLYLADMTVAPVPSRLGVLDPDTLDFKVAGPIPLTENSPELTGTAAGILYAYFPGKTSYIRQLDKSTGKTLKEWNLSIKTGNVGAWTFSHWGGQFYIFVTDAWNSQLYVFTPQTGKTTQLLSNLPHRIVGAGVSTRAPLVRPDMGPSLPEAGPGPL
jgi:hypothetical protein